MPGLHWSGPVYLHPTEPVHTVLAGATRAQPPSFTRCLLDFTHHPIHTSRPMALSKPKMTCCSKIARCAIDSKRQTQVVPIFTTLMRLFFAGNFANLCAPTEWVGNQTLATGRPCINGGTLVMRKCCRREYCHCKLGTQALIRGVFPFWLQPPPPHGPTRCTDTGRPAYLCAVCVVCASLKRLVNVGGM